MKNLPLTKAFTAYTISTYFNNYIEKLGTAPYLGTGLFPKVKTQRMVMKYIKGSRGLPVSLTPSNYDAQATLRNRIGFETMEHDMPFFRESYLVKEKDAAEYEEVMNSNDPQIARDVLRNIMLEPIDLINGANVVPERMIWQLLMPVDGSPKISIHANGVNYDYNYDVDGNYKANNFMELTSETDKWTDFENSDPYLDLRKAQKTMKTKYGIKPTVALLNDETFQLIVQNKKIQNYLLAQNLTANILVEDVVVEDFFKKTLGITFVVYDKMYKNEDGEAVKFAVDNMVTLLPSLAPLGETKYGKTPEERDGGQSGASLAIVETGVAVYTYTSQHPINQHCIVSEIVMPSYERMDDTYVLKVA